MKKKKQLLCDKIVYLEKSKEGKISNEITYTHVAQRELGVKDDHNARSKIIANRNNYNVQIKPEHTQMCTTTKQDVQKNIDPVHLKASINRIKEVNNGGMIISCSKELDKKNIRILLQEKLGTNCEVTPKN